MNIHTDKTTENKNKTSSISQVVSKSSGSTHQLIDNRSTSVVQKKLFDKVDQSSQKELPAQLKENNTGLPNQLKSGIENLSGHSMDDVKVHYNSAKPAQLNAHAYAQGSNIHLAAGQEKHLPHEAWHVVQQKQGRVKPTKQLKAKVNINDDKKLEKEADIMGARAAQLSANDNTSVKLQSTGTIASEAAPVQGVLKELAIAMLLLFGGVHQAGWKSDEAGMIARRPLSHKLAIDHPARAIGLNLPASHLAPDTQEHPLGLGLFHTQVFHNTSNLSDNIGMFDTGVQADSDDMLNKYIPYIKGLDSAILKRATKTVKKRWKKKKYSVTSSNCQNFAAEVYQQYLKIAPDKPAKSWSVYIADKIVEIDDAYIGHINSNVKADIDKKMMSEYRKKMQETLAGNKFAALATHAGKLSDNIHLNGFIEQVVHVISGKSKQIKEKGGNPTYTKDGLYELIMAFGKKEIESQVPTPAHWEFSSRLVEHIARKVAAEIYSRLFS